MLGGLAVLIRLPALFATRVLVFDDGVFGASALAMRTGELPFRDVFSSQGPLFLPLVWVFDLLGFRTLNGPRLLDVAAGVLVTVATYAAARRITSRGAAWLAAGLVTTSGSVLWVTGPINADGPSMALATLAVALAFRYRARPGIAGAVAIGLAVGAVFSIKMVAAPVVLPVGLILLGRRRLGDMAAAAGGALAVYALAALPWGYGDVLDQSFRYHRDSARELPPARAARKVVTTLFERDLPVVVTAALAAVSAAVRRLRGPAGAGSPDRTVPWILGAWAAGLAALFVWEPALWRSHVAQIVPALALLAVCRPPPWRVLAVAGVLVLPIWATVNRPILWPGPETGWEARLTADLRELPGGTLVIGDMPGYAWRAGHAPPGELADTSFKRIEQGQITEASLARAARADDVCAVFAVSRRHFLRFDGLGAALEREGYQPVQTYGAGRTLWVRDTCR